MLLSAAFSAGVAYAQDFVGRVNQPFSRIAKEKRSDLIILPALMKMEPAPAEVDSILSAFMMTSNSAGWDAAEAWATAQPQKDVLKALTDVTRDENYQVAMVFAQGYGVEAVADQPELISAEMYTELGDPPTLATAKFGYLEKMEDMVKLSHIEATRLMKEGNFVGAIDTIFDIMYFSRQMADRPMLEEKATGMMWVGRSLERIRDIVYQDLRSETHKLSYQDLRRYVERLEEQKGYLSIGRIQLPTGTFIAADQILHRVLVEKQGVNQELFSATLARVSASGRPLRLFSESAYWETARSQHEGWYASRDMLVGPKEDGGLVADWTKRWNLDPHDSYLKLPSDYRRYVATGPRFAALRAVLRNVESLYDLRMALRVEVAGTRMALAIYGFSREHNGAFPQDISSIRPAYVPMVDLDPYATAKRPLGYFVPIRDNIPRQDPRKDPAPWMIHCYVDKPYESFVVPLRSDTFVLFSVGPDNVGVNAKDATQADRELEGDYLLWPPIMSLVRQNLIDKGELQ